PGRRPLLSNRGPVMNYLTFLILLFASWTALSETPEEREQLHRGVHDMRILMEQSGAEAEAKARGAVIGLFTGGAGANPAVAGNEVMSISQMRQEMNQSFERIENMFPCLGANIDVDDGQAILICGDNSGSARNDNFEYEDNDNFDLRRDESTHIYLPARPAEETAR
ncbi:MAG: hypothetical protein ACE5G3_03130, partial [Gammaproteobacteria bacterium]